MGHYKGKVLDYGYKEKTLVYHSEIETGNNTSAKHREKYSDMNELKQEKSDERRLRYYRKKVAELTEIALMNTDLTTAITLTFSESVTSYDIALARWQLFLKRLRHICKEPLKYICVWEYQKQRSEKEGIESGGVFHFHCLTNIGFIEHSKLEKIWGYGFVWVESLKNDYKRNKAIAYIMKYITKEVAENTGEHGKRYIFTSNNLIKPKVTLITEDIKTQDVIWAHLEDMIRDGIYDIRTAGGKKINHVDYVEYEK